MNTAKIAGISIIIGIIAFATAPYWGGCKIAYSTCKLSCEIKHFNSSFKKTVCKAGCAADKISCLSK